MFYVAVAVAFGVWMLLAHGMEFGTDYFAGYIVEKSLSVDNLFVFVLVMTTFAVPEEHQHKVLTFGIVLAMITRAVFIAVGAALISPFTFVFLLFGLLVIYTAVQLFRHRDEDPDIEDNVVVKTARRFLPVTDDYVGGKLVTRVQGPRDGREFAQDSPGSRCQGTRRVAACPSRWRREERLLTDPGAKRRADASTSRSRFVLRRCLPEVSVSGLLVSLGRGGGGRCS